MLWRGRSATRAKEFIPTRTRGKRSRAIFRSTVSPCASVATGWTYLLRQNGSGSDHESEVFPTGTIACFFFSFFFFFSLFCLQDQSGRRFGRPHRGTGTSRTCSNPLPFLSSFLFSSMYVCVDVCWIPVWFGSDMVHAGKDEVSSRGWRVSPKRVQRAPW